MLLVVFGWLGIAGVGGPYFGKIDQVSNNDLALFLPKDAESTKVKEKLEKFQDTKTLPMIVVFEADQSLSAAQKQEIETIRAAITNTGHTVDPISAPIVSEDGRAEFMVVPLASDAKIKTVVPEVQRAVHDAKPTTRTYFAGPAMFSRDLAHAFAGIDGTLLVVALCVVFMILLVVYRSPVLPIVTLLGAIIALAGAILVVWHLADAGVVQLNGQVQGILFILVIGAATDYSLLYIARYREELVQHKDTWVATKAAWKAAFEPILAAGGTVTLGLLCLLFSGLGSNKALGPVGGIGVVFAVLIALTYLPAMLLLLGRNGFWPSRPRYVKSNTPIDYHKSHPVWARVGAFVQRHPRRIWVGVLSVLLLACCFVPQLRAEGVSQTELVLGKSEARDGQKALDRHFSSGSGSPTYVLVNARDTAAVVRLLDADRSVSAVSTIPSDSTKGILPLGKSAVEIKDSIAEKITKSRDEQLAEIRTQLAAEMAGYPEEAIEQAYAGAIAAVPSVQALVEKANPFAGLSPKEIDGKVVLQATLKDPASSVAAREAVQRLRTTIQPKYHETMFGGVSAIQLDTNDSSKRDLYIVIPMILLAITIVLMLLLRSIIAPLVLLLTTVISFGATLGIAALLFNNVWHFGGADPAVIIFGFVFLVALGIDYNIFLMTRVREETMKLGVQRGTIKALIVTGGVITSAGVVLAATFAALYVIPILFLAQIAFIVAFGVLLDTLIVRSLLVPALTLEIGRYMWWPSKIAKK